MTSVSLLNGRAQRRFFYLLALALTSGSQLLAQRTLADGATALTGVQNGLTTYIQPITNICYIVAALVAIVGGVQVYSKMTSGDPGAGKTAATWFGGAVFLILIPTIVTSLFGVQMS